MFSAHEGLRSHPADKPPRLIPQKDVTNLVQIAGGNLGKGSFGKVFRATFERHLVIVKEPLVSDMEAQLQEYNTLTPLPPHPHVLALIGGIISDNQVLLVCPYMPGGSLADLMKREPQWGATDPSRTQVAVADLFDGMAHLHAHDIVHRDGISTQTQLELSASLSVCLSV